MSYVIGNWFFVKREDETEHGEFVYELHSDEYYNGEETFCDNIISKDDAERIVLCVNYCRGLSNKELKSGRGRSLS